MWQGQEFVRRIGTVLRIQNDDYTHEPLPQRWIDIIRYLDEKERKELEAQQSETQRQVRRPSPKRWSRL